MSERRTERTIFDIFWRKWQLVFPGEFLFHLQTKACLLTLKISQKRGLDYEYVMMYLISSIRDGSLLLSKHLNFFYDRSVFDYVFPARLTHETPCTDLNQAASLSFYSNCISWVLELLSQSPACPFSWRVMARAEINESKKKSVSAPRFTLYLFSISLIALIASVNAAEPAYTIVYS